MGKDDQRQRDCLPLDFLAGLGWAGLGCVVSGKEPLPTLAGDWGQTS